MKFAMAFIGALLLVGCDSGLENKRKDQVGNTVVGQALARGKDEKCMSNLHSIRQGIELAKGSDENGAAPATLEELRGFPKDMLIDPIDKKPYTYDPATGNVKCKHLGHEKY
ncbi:MAG: hypothetical protein K8R88_04920 [Armatimonadetes bacterium]|nr:hypothetical protein [Armatimonadota bacterium]